MLRKGTTRKIALSMLERVFSLLASCRGAFNVKEGRMGLIELLLIVLVIAAVAGGIGVSPLLWLLLLVALVVFFTGGGFGYRRGGRV
jgi:hypothetical protein